MNENDDRIFVESAPDVGSERLAAALAAGDVVALGQALRHDYVVLPLFVTPGGETQNRVFPSNDPTGEKPWALALFSSTQTLELFLRDDETRLFALVRGPGLVSFLNEHAGVLHRVHFDPAGPHAMSARVEDVLRSLEPRLLDDDVAWATAQPVARAAAGDAAQTLSPGARAVAIDTPLSTDWAVVDVTDAQKRSGQVRQLLDRQLGGLVNRRLRTDLEGWFTRLSELAVGAGGRFLAFMIRHSDAGAAAINLTLYWHELGPAIGDVSHLERMTAQLRGGLGPDDELLGAETAAGPFVRHTRVRRGAADLAASDRPLLVTDYWLAFPDGRGLVQYCFASPHVDERGALSRLYDNIVVGAQWVMEES
ncbi:MAG TPA: hypothetical protein VGC45_14065 [Gryllotalpicola sp.]